MARMKVTMPDEFLKKLSRLGDKIDYVLPDVLKAGAEVVEEKVRSNLSSVIGTGTKTPSRSTGQLLAAVGTSPARLDKNGEYNVRIGFAEPRSDGKSNAMVASILEYGKSGQPPKPFFKPAISASKKAAIEAMKAKLESEVKGS